MGAVAAGAVMGGRASAAPAVPAGPPPRFSLRDLGIIDDGVTDYTDRINQLYVQAAQVGASVHWDTTLGKGFVISGSGMQVPKGARSVGPGCALNRPASTLEGAFLLPKDASTSALMTFGQVKQDATNPNGSSVRGLGFRGTAPAGDVVPGLRGVVVNDCTDVTVEDCVAIDFDPTGTGGGAFLWNRSINGRCFRSAVYRCGYGIMVDGSGATDGKIDDFQANACVVSVSLGASGANFGGNAWYLGPGVHLSGGPQTTAHLYVGPVIRTMKCTGVYFDTAGGWQINYQGTGLQLSNCFFLYGQRQGTDDAHCPINLADPGDSFGPDSSIIGCRLNVASAQGFVRLGTVGQPSSLIFEGNTVSANGAPAPATWLGHVLNSAPASAPPAVLAGSTNGTSDFAAVNQVAWPT